MRNTAMVSPPFGGLKSVCFRGKDGLYASQIPQRGKPIGGGLSDDCGRKNIKFSVPFGAVLKGDVMEAIKMDDDVQAATEYEKTP